VTNFLEENEFNLPEIYDEMINNFPDIES